MIVLEIPAAPPGLNMVLRMGWQRRHSLTRKWRKSIWAARCQVIHGRPTPIAKAKVLIERTSPNLLDTDNLYGSVKVVLDALRCNELIVDDNPESLTLGVTQKKGPPHLRIQIEDVLGAPKSIGSNVQNPPTSAICASKPHSESTASAVTR